jgi:pimeloyl-ACP methyl ester carboxylesterase
MSDSIKLTVPTPDGRDLEVLDAGPRDGFPLVFHHGTPQGAVPLGIVERPAAERNLRVISYSRPGYGGSTPHPHLDGKTVADDATDVATILDHLGLGDFVTLGWSGGGPRALACAAMLPDRCIAATCGVGIAPADEFDGDIRDGMGEENVAEYTAAFESREALEAFLTEESAFLSAGPDDLITAFGDLAPPVDRDALTGEFAEYLAASLAAAGRQGIRGWRDDDLTHIRPWGFDLGSITVPVAIWQGTQDRMVPFAHAQWLATHVSGARAHLVEGEGHLSLFMKMAVILDDLLDLARR